MSDAPVLSVVWQVSWHAAAVAAVVLAARAVFGRAVAARWRHALWAVVLCRLVMPVAPHSRVSLFALWHPVGPRPAPVTANPPVLATPGTPWRVAMHDADGLVGVDTPAPVAPPRWPAVLLVVWASVAVGLFARLAVANVRFTRRLARTGRPARPELAALFDDCRRTMRAGRRATLVVTDAVATPAACGVLRPRVLLPTTVADALPPDRARLVFLHELAHVRCHDVAVDWAWAIVRCGHWFNPVVWLVGPVRRHDREVARDEMVLAVVGDDQAEAYGRTLLDLARPGHRPVAGVGLVGLFDGRGLRDRVRRVARPRRRRSAWVGAAVLAVAGCASLTNPPPPKPSTAVDAPTVVTDPPDVNPDAPTPAMVATLAKLDRHLPDVRFNPTPLADVIDYLRNQTGTSITVDWRALEAAGIPRTAPVVARLRDVRASKAMTILFKNVEGDDYAHQLAYAVDADGDVTISTRRELDRDTAVTRKYDVSDLLADSADDNGHAAAEVASMRDQRLAAIEQTIRQNVVPNGWADASYHADADGIGRIQSDRMRGVLLITQTPQNQRDLRSVLASLRASQAARGLQVSLSVRLVTVFDADLTALPTNLERLLRQADADAARGTRGSPLSRADADAITAATTPDGVLPVLERPLGVELVTPRFTVFSGQRTTFTTDERRDYTVAYTAVVSPNNGGTAYEPVMRSVQTGLTFDVQATASPDRRSAVVDLHPSLSRLAGVVAEPWPGAPPGVMTQRPVVLTSTARASCSIADGTTLLLPCGGFAPPAGGPPIGDPAVAAAVDRARRAHVYLLVRPTVITTADPRTP